MMTGRIFVDSGGWIAVTDTDDKFHASAAAYYRSEPTRQSRLITTDFVLDEVITRLRYDLAYRHARAFIESIHRSAESGALRVEPITQSLWQRAERIFEVYRGTKLSFTDCTSFALLEQIEVDEVFGFDSHFEMMDHVLVPK